MDKDFKAWFETVDVEVSKISGVSVHDLADMNFWDMWNDGVSATEAAEAALENEEFPF